VNDLPFFNAADRDGRRGADGAGPSRKKAPSPGGRRLPWGTTLSRARRREDGLGFTLVELLVVMAILAILAAASVAGFRSVSSALGLSTAGQLITSEITTARQTALTYSETVEVRFYYYMDSYTGTSQYQAIQSFSTQDGVNYTQMDRMSFLPSNIMISQTTGTSTTALSYPFGESNTTVNPTYQVSATGTVTLNGSTTTINGVQTIAALAGQGYQYKSLRFKPGGSIDFVIPSSGAPSGWPPTSWYITLFEKKYASAANANIKNFITVNVDATDGRVRTFQP